MSEILSPNKHVGRIKPIRLIVIHTMEVSESDANVAEAVGNAFARTATKASAHVGIDTNSECRYVADKDTAWAAPGANADGLQEELAGRAGQTTGNWTDADSKAILERAAQRTASWCRTHNIPARHLTNTQLAAGARGIVGHDQVSHVYKRSSHWDPGPNFPWVSFLARVNALLPTTATPKETDMPLTPAEMNAVADLTVRKLLGTTLGRSDVTVAQSLQRAAAASAAIDTKALAAQVAAAIPAGTAITQPQLEAALRVVLGSVDKV